MLPEHRAICKELITKYGTPRPLKSWGEMAKYRTKNYDYTRTWVWPTFTITESTQKILWIMSKTRKPHPISHPVGDPTRWERIHIENPNLFQNITKFIKKYCKEPNDDT